MELPVLHDSVTFPPIPVLMDLATAYLLGTLGKQLLLLDLVSTTTLSCIISVLGEDLLYYKLLFPYLKPVGLCVSRIHTHLDFRNIVQDLS